jgi:hypothetical protein
MASHTHIATLSDRLAEADGPVLVDGCPRCVELAKDPILYLDDQHIEALWEQMLVTEQCLGREWDDRKVSQLDDVARRDLWRIYLFLERHSQLAADKLLADEERHAREAQV